MRHLNLKRFGYIIASPVYLVAAEQPIVVQKSHQTTHPDEWQLRLFDFVEDSTLSFKFRIPAKPEWNYFLQQRQNTTALIISSPKLQAPPLGIDIIALDTFSMSTNELHKNSLIATQMTAKKVNYNTKILLSDLKKTAYGNNAGYQFEFSSHYEGADYDFIVFNGILGKEIPISITATTTAGDMDKNTYYIHKIISNIEPK